MSAASDKCLVIYFNIINGQGDIGWKLCKYIPYFPVFSRITYKAGGVVVEATTTTITIIIIDGNNKNDLDTSSRIV